MVENLSWEWRWLKKYYKDMLAAIEKTAADGKERGFFITRNRYNKSSESPQRIARSRIQIGEAGSVTLKMKPLDIQFDDDIISFHTHPPGMGSPSQIDEKTALSFGEAYTVIGYFNEEQPHIQMWRIKCVNGETKVGLIKKF